MNEVCFVIGNGWSRDDIDTKALKKFGHTVGCNYIYRTDMTIDMLVIQDNKCVKAAVKFSYPEDQIACLGNMPFDLPPRTLDTGQIAVWQAVKKFKPKITMLLGYDFIYDRERDNVNDPGIMYNNTLTHDWENAWRAILQPLSSDTYFIRVGDPLNLRETFFENMTLEKFFAHYPTTRKKNQGTGQDNPEAPNSDKKPLN